MDQNSKENASLEWKNGVPLSAQFSDPYFSLSDGLEETRYVFLEGNRLSERLKDGFHIAELGFGTGLNALALWELWRKLGLSGVLKMTSFEAYPMHVSDMKQALAVWPELAPLAHELCAAFEKGFCLKKDGFELSVILGDASETLPRSGVKADAWFLDGFSPAKNPEMWSPQLMRAVADHTAPHGTFATFTAAGHVRRALEGAGFEVFRKKGFGTKRHMSFGVKPSSLSTN